MLLPPDLADQDHHHHHNSHSRTAMEQAPANSDNDITLRKELLALFEYNINLCRDSIVSSNISFGQHKTANFTCAQTALTEDLRHCKVEITITRRIYADD
jgi:hypothetical protein